MEGFMLNAIATYARSAGLTYITGEYIPTSKNELVKNHYQELGFRWEDGLWMLDVEKYKAKKVFINNQDYGNK